MTVGYHPYHYRVLLTYSLQATKPAGLDSPQVLQEDGGFAFTSHITLALLHLAYKEGTGLDYDGFTSVAC